MLCDGYWYPAGHRRVPSHTHKGKKYLIQEQKKGLNKTGKHLSCSYFAEVGARDCTEDGVPEKGVGSQEKASKFLKRSDLWMKIIVSVKISSLLIPLYALLPYNRMSVR